MILAVVEESMSKLRHLYCYLLLFHLPYCLKIVLDLFLLRLLLVCLRNSQLQMMTEVLT